MKKNSRRLLFVLASVALLYFPNCGGGEPEVIPTAQQVAIQINAPKLAVFDEAAQIITQRGWAIISSNERLGLITTDYKQLEESWGGGLASRMFGKKLPEVMLTTNIVTDKDVSLLTIFPKGRILHEKKGGHWDAITFNEEFLAKVKEITENIKAEIEAKK